ncbi:aminotransferase class III-fold pyridoxal phosphate-dependent enzyme [Actinomadura montaniterrae]|uniref:aminotransferase class III-fold pyridoxal phosphate-dependent enzyme n=1 Tax=Actinomadura montaniterrae TaxID=1803903 RepID=UPI001CEF9442|nr:aminotransferase class III-fold pyridoxal phosphate-dependent enzyme [Actinomadura montaniterrae]
MHPVIQGERAASRGEAFQQRQAPRPARRRGSWPPGGRRPRCRGGPRAASRRLLCLWLLPWSRAVTGPNDLDSVRALYEAHPDRIAAVIMEPIPHNVGALASTWEFVAGLRALTTEDGSLLIFDEVITGFRHALGGYKQVCGVLPDLTTFGEAMGNGNPLAGLAGPRRMTDRGFLMLPLVQKAQPHLFRPHRAGRRPHSGSGPRRPPHNPR